MLVSPLDWGLGHTTRCVPIIQTLLHQGCDVVIACNSRQKEILSQEFPTVRFVHLDGYNIRYGKNRWHTLGWLFVQAPRILTKIKQENQWLKAFLSNEHVDAIISDNRFGLFSATIPAVFITHQLRIRTGLGIWVDRFVTRWNYRRIEQFNECWIPDTLSTPSLAGDLSHPATMPRIPARYIGCLSRLAARPSTEAVAGTHDDASTILIILSGPEPLRSILEQQLLREIEDAPHTFVMIRGLAGTAAMPAFVPANCRILNHATAINMVSLIREAGLVICRTGYTSVMDLLLLHKKTILIPTPGQAEQEYLAQHLLKHQWAFTVSQKDFSLPTALQEAARFPYRTPALNSQEHQTAITELVQQITR